ncbi:9319_t:CDS:2 [Funneliformis geosporum]|uniref:1903_t:CDS:1 n=1 Tax=Funneliformis geosporum TaxID=1117311 RepID=A0A9W4WKC3_9GLOM|nr:1903_t:CDS:2 [Funneliformis geosporum]CAI2172208.1 9319_t:CDS:2 [Funneliformis geosporum]
MEIVIAILSFVPAKSLYRYRCLSKELKFEIHKILVERIKDNFKSGKNYLLATIEPLDTHSSGPTHIFDLILLDINLNTLEIRFKINTKLNNNISCPKIIGRKLEGTGIWETTRQNVDISLKSSWTPFNVDHHSADLSKFASLHVFSPIDLSHKATFVAKGIVTFNMDIKPETLVWWKKPIDIHNQAILVVRNTIGEFDVFDSIIVMAYVEEVVIKAGILLTAMEEKWKNAVTSVVIEDFYE